MGWIGHVAHTLDETYVDNVDRNTWREDQLDDLAQKGG
jgi:hypothetical protein